VFFRYKHRADAIEEKVGLKVGENKNMLVKDYQDSMDKKFIILNNEDNIREITSFVKHITSSGNIRYAADMGHDDTVMTLVNMSSVFSRYDYKEMVEDHAPKLVEPSKITLFKSYLGKQEITEGTDYQSLINVNRRRRLTQQVKLNSTKTWWN
jgi:hypothetical protein